MRYICTRREIREISEMLNIYVYVLGVINMEMISVRFVQ